MTKLYIGTYTKSKSEGIYTADFNTTTGELSNLTLIAKTNNPTYLDTDTITQRLFSVTDNAGKGGVSFWDLRTQPLTLVTQFLEEGKAPCYVHYDPKIDTLYDANYHMGSVSVYAQDRVEKKFQYYNGSHAHYVKTDIKTEDVYVCDLGLDVVRKYRLLNEIATYHTPQGSGPRHLVVHPTLPFLYVFCELSNEILVLEDDGFDLIHIQTVSSLPETVSLRNGGAAIRITNDGRHVYASNRSNDTLSAFSVLENGRLELIQNIATDGTHPRDFTLSDDDAYVLVANRDTDNISVFKRDSATGQLSLQSSDFFAPECVCVHFSGGDHV